jgi:lipopolysaccharide export LptBFGC system permease protein LptF
MAKKVKDHFEDLTDDSKAYLRSLFEYYRLDALKKSTKAIATLIRLAVKGLLLLLLFIFLSIGLSFLIGNYVHSVAYGFMIVGGIYLIFLIIFAFIAKPVSESFSLRFIYNIIKAEDEEDNQDNEQ